MGDIKVSKTEWKKTDKRFVAFFDIMGFKDLVMRNEHETILKLLYKLSNQRELLHNANNQMFESKDDKTAKPFTTGESISFTFSDSIIFFSKSDSVKDYKKIVLDCIVLLHESLNAGIPIKGALSYGEITVDTAKSIYFGQPIIDAYLLGEELQMYAVIMDHEFELKAKELSREKFKNSFVAYKAPLKSGRATHSLIRAYNKDVHVSSLNSLYSKSYGRPRQYIDNTMAFVNEVDCIDLKIDSEDMF
ncbi:MAG TPA: hypothetical protein VK806_02545 [Bacteroidia bacterium]|nr:hypothetical protein [Bacteroidia bacterium]